MTYRPLKIKEDCIRELKLLSQELNLDYSDVLRKALRKVKLRDLKVVVEEILEQEQDTNEPVMRLIDEDVVDEINILRLKLSAMVKREVPNHIVVEALVRCYKGGS